MDKVLIVVVFLMALVACAIEPESSTREVWDDQLFGRWDVTVKTPNGNFPSWWEIYRQDEVIVGRFVGRLGSSRPIDRLEVIGDQFKFSLPIQYEEHKTDLMFSGRLGQGRLKGTTNAENGSILEWEAFRAPDLEMPSDPRWGEPIQLFNGTNLRGWKARHLEAPNNWRAKDGVLANTDKGTDLMTDDVFQDFKLHTEFRYPQGSNSGVYLRGRYEVQVQDDFGKEPSNLNIGAVYGFLTPTKNAAKKADEWQSLDITLLGRRITIELNGEMIVEKQEIPGITGGALNSHEGEAGPILLQGDHGPVYFRNLMLTPVKQ